MALAVIGLFVGSEIVFRVGFFGLHGITCPGCYTPRPIPSGRWTVPDDDPMISYRLRPSMDEWFKGAPIHTSSFGFRTGEMPEGTNGGHEPRVVVLGRSISMGSGVTEDSVYSELLQEWLREFKPGAAVFNLSVGGYSFLQVAENYRRWEARVRPNVVILPVTLTDVDALVDSVPQQFVDRGFQWLQVREYFGDSFVYRMIRQYARNGLVSLGLNPDWRVRWMKIPLKADGVPEGSFRSLDVLADFVTYLRGRGVQVMVLIVRRVDEVPIEVQRELVARWESWAAQLEGVRLVDTVLPLNGRVGSGDAIYPGDPHPKAKVHCYYAAVALPILVEMVTGEPGGSLDATLDSRCGWYAR